MIKRPEEERMHQPDEADLDRDLADQRTRRIPRVTEEDPDPVVRVHQEPPYTHVHHEAPASVLVARKAQQAVWYFFGVLETLLALRFISSGRCVAKSMNWKPNTCTPFSSTRLRGIRGMSPDAKPTVTKRPRTHFS